MIRENEPAAEGPENQLSARTSTNWISWSTPHMAEQVGDFERTPIAATCIPVVNQQYITATTLRAMCSAAFGRSPGPQSPSPTVPLFRPSWRSGCCSAAGSGDLADSDDEDSKNIVVLRLHREETLSYHDASSCNSSRSI